MRERERERKGERETGDDDIVMSDRDFHCSHRYRLHPRRAHLVDCCAHCGLQMCSKTTHVHVSNIRTHHIHMYIYICTHMCVGMCGCICIVYTVYRISYIVYRTSYIMCDIGAYMCDGLCGHTVLTGVHTVE